MSNGLVEYFGDLPDPRVRGRTDYPLIEIVFLCISAIVSGFDGWEAIEDFGQGKLDWLRKFLPYEHGIPRHDTVARVMSCLSPKALQSCFVSWVQSIAKITDGEIVAIDGKQARRSYDKKNRKAAIHMVSAWACQNGVVLGQQKTDTKSNEITAIPQLLDILELKGCIVTIDAMGCQRDIAKKIRECGADYVLALKGNQSELQEMVSDFFSTAIKKNFAAVEHSRAEENDYGHGRIESRVCYAVPLPDYLKDFGKEWADLKSLACIISSRDINNVVTQETRYYISSLEANAPKINHAIRCHWHVENSLHWVMDVTFKEDDSRIRRGVAAENMSVMRHLALNLIRKESESKFSVPRKRRKASLYDEYREKVLRV
jgi:predicted transposase YbfD/YdcC